MIWQRNITIFNRESIFNRYFFPLPCQFTNRVSGKSRWWFLKYVCHLSPLTLRFQFFIQFEDCAYMFDSWVGGKNHLSSHCWGWFCSNNPPFHHQHKIGWGWAYVLNTSCPSPAFRGYNAAGSTASVVQRCGRLGCWVPRRANGHGRIGSDGIGTNQLGGACSGSMVIGTMG